jgi:subtilisin family serine protease
VLVAAVGNGDEAFSQPWPYASYPAALPHVIGVGALTHTGNVPDFSNRDLVFNDLTAPGSGIFSTFPAALTGQRPLCTDQGFSDCGPDDYRNPEGTSFAAPQVSAAAAVLLAVAPLLTANQVAVILEQNADDVNAATGCEKCTLLRDARSGWGRLNVAKAVAALAVPLPAADQYETNDDAGTQAHTLWGKQMKFNATIDYYDDPIDVYRIALSGRERITANVAAGWTGARVSLMLWKPGTKRIDEAKAKTLRVAQSAMPGASQKVTFTAPGRGWYYVEVKVASPGFGPYTLTLSKKRPALAK